MVATVAGIGNEEPPMVIMAGYGAVPPEGFRMLAEKDADLPPCVIATVMPVPLRVALTDSGGPGKSPSSYCSMALRISMRRQSQSALVVTFLPLAVVKGSGSL